MKSKIDYSIFCSVITGAIMLALFIGCVLTVRETSAFITFLIIYLALFIPALFYAPGYIRATPDFIIMGSLLRKRLIAMSDVESVELYQPTMGAIRLLASGGFMGYWGLFREGDVGRYYGFYGKASDGFMVRMKNGDKYVLGCADPEEMVKYIRSNMTK